MKIIITIEVDGENVNVSTETKETEKEVIEKKDNSLYDLASNYARVFDGSCTEWTKDPEYNLMFLKQQQRYANDVLKSKGHLFLNEVYDMLGIPRTKAGQVVGWIYDEEHPIGDNCVDFDLHNERNYDFINGNENTAILDFNVDGNILDRI